MAAAVRTDANSRDALEIHLEIVDVGLVQDEENIRPGEIARSNVGIDVTGETARIVAQASVDAGGAGGDGAKIHSVVFKRAIVDAAASKAALEVKRGLAGESEEYVGAVGNEDSVARDRSRGAVKHWIILWVCRVLGPFPVRLVASIAALITEGLLIDPSEVAVP